MCEARSELEMVDIISIGDVENSNGYWYFI